MTDKQRIRVALMQLAKDLTNGRKRKDVTPEEISERVEFTAQWIERIYGGGDERREAGGMGPT